MILDFLNIKNNKDENVHRFALRATRGKLLETGREKERDRDSLGILYTGYLLSIVNIKKEIERERKERRREREKKERKSKYHHKRQNQKV